MEGNITDLISEYSERVIDASTSSTVFYSIILSVGSIGNVFVLYVYSMKMCRDKMEPRFFIPFLAFYDLLVGISSGTYFLSQTYMWISFHGEGFNPDGVCRGVLFLVILTITTSDSFLLAIAVQRYIKICRPHGRQMTPLWRKLTVALVISVNFVYSLPTALFSGVKERKLVFKEHSISGPGCFTGNMEYPVLQISYYSFLIVIYISNIIVTAGMYTPIAIVIYRKFHSKRLQLKTHDTGKQSSNSENGGRRVDANFNLMFFIIIITYILAYAPSASMLIIINTNKDFWSSLTFSEFGTYNWLFRCYSINHCANPFIYAYFDLEFRHHIVKLFWHRKSSRSYDL